MVTRRAPPPAVKARPVELAPHMSVAEGLTTIVHNCLSQVQANAPGVTRGRDPESVHQMRVGLRRLRSALRLFEPLAPVPPALADEVRWLVGELGPARDWEVLAGSTLPALAAEGPDREALDAVRAAASAVAARHRRDAAGAVRSPRYDTLLRELGGWLVEAPWLDTLTPEQRAALDAPLPDWSTSVLDRLQRKLLRRGQGLAHADAPQRHRTRIAAKRLRYALEFLRSLYPDKASDRTVQRLSALQDTLGALNDAAVAQGLLQTLAQAQPELATGCAYARGHLAARAADTSAVKPAWRRFTAKPPPWAG